MTEINNEQYKDINIYNEPNSIWLDNCFNILPKINEKSIDLIICDMPYGQTQNHWDSELPLPDLWNQYQRIIKPNGAICLFGQGIFAAKLILSNEKWFKYDLVWKKGKRVSGFLNSKRMPLRNHEQILVFYQKQPIYNPQFTVGKPLHGKGKSFFNEDHKPVNGNYNEFNKEDGSRAGSTQKYPISVLDFEKPHPAIHSTQKPVKLCEWLIKTYTNENQIVLDNCMGIGTTCIAAKNTNRKYIGIEKEQLYFDKAKELLK